jgi:hypothetical protein
MAAPTLRSSTVQQINDNIIQACLVPEFFPPGIYGHGSVVPLPISPVDGYPYSRAEIFYLWSINDLDPAGTSSSLIRLPIFAPSIDATTGVVTINTWRFPPGGPDVLTNDGSLRVILVGFRQAQIPVLPAPPPGPPADAASLTGDFGPYDISVFMSGVQVDPSQVLGKIILPRKVNFQQGFSESTATAGTGPTGTAVFSIQINGSEIATVTFPGGFFTVTGNAYLSFLSPESISTFNGVSDVLSVVGPATPDPTLADVGIVIAAKRAF